MGEWVGLRISLAWSVTKAGRSRPACCPMAYCNEAGKVMRELDVERWSRAEERAAELVACIQPNQPSEARRKAVVDYVRRLIMNCISCQVIVSNLFSIVRVA